MSSHHEKLQIFDAPKFQKPIDDRLGDEFLRLHIDREMEILNALSGGRPDRRNLHISDAAGVVIEAIEHLKKGINTVNARKNQPFVLKCIAN